MTPAFAITPTADDLSRLERDLRFHPSTVTHPQSLTAEQVAQFNREGYIKGIRIFSREEADANRRYFDGLLVRVLEAGGDSYSISSAHLKYGKAWDLLTHPR